MPISNASCSFIVLYILIRLTSSAPEAPSLVEIFKHHENFVSDKMEHYLHAYDKLFDTSRRNPIQLLELGVQNGGSLEIWRKYFTSPGATFIGVDIDTKVCNLDLPDGVETFCFDLSEQKNVIEFSNSRTFDIIIDDASHICSHVVKTFVLLFQSLKPGGVYVIEDMGTSYWKSHADCTYGLREPLKPITTIDFFKHLIDVIQIHHIDDQFWLSDFFAVLGKDLVVYFSRWIESVRFEDALIVVRKQKVEKSHSYKRVMTGTTAIVLPSRGPLFFSEYYQNAAELLSSIFRFAVDAL